MNPETYFADTVAAGWAPKNPCINPHELTTLLESWALGDCLIPLVESGDWLYVDPNAKPEPGDIVAITLSQRGADAQNSALPPGARAKRPGDVLIKLYGRRHGMDMLYERFGGEATATLLNCESPDDTPIFHPVRQIRRNGQLLYGSPVSPPAITRRALLAGGVVAPLVVSGCGGSDDPLQFNPLPACEDNTGDGGQIGLNAATALFTTSVPGPIAPPATFATIAAMASITVGPFSVDVNCVVTAMATYDNASTTRTNQLNYGLSDTAGHFTSQQSIAVPLATGGGDSVGLIAQEYTYSLAAGTTQTYYLNASVPAAPAFSIPIINIEMKVEAIKR